MLDIFMFRIDFLARPECSMTLSPLSGWLFKLTMPVYFLLCFLAYYLYSKYLRVKLWRQDNFRENLEVAMTSIKSSCLRACAQVLSFCYIFVVQKAASAGDCSLPDASDGAVPRLDWNESIKCTPDDPIWPGMAVLGFLVFMSYGVAGPWWLWRVLKRARAPGSRKYADPTFQALYGWMPVRFFCRTLLFSDRNALHWHGYGPGSRILIPR